jgi:uncharacterized protein (TIGR03083 family)
MPSTIPDPPEDWLAALHGSHRTLSGLVTPMGADEVAGPSYASEWSIAQTLSHLGSGAEIFSTFLGAGLRGEPTPDMSGFPAVWARWDAKSPEDQARDGLAADAAFLAELDELSDTQRAAWRLALFGTDQHLSDLLRLRLGEHALHTWDIAVMRDPGATLPDDATALCIDGLGQMAGRVGKPPAEPLSVRVHTRGPERHFALDSTGEGITLELLDGAPGGDGATVDLPAEALIRLVGGRLDPAHAPSVECAGIALDELRQVFPGF